MVDYAFQKRKLAEKHVKVQDEWIDACIQWLSTETENKNLLPSQLHGLVYEQWLMSDLRDISVASLPNNINSQLGRGMLEGIYTLQINYAFNIGVSAYSQLQKCKGLSVDDPPTEKSSKFGKSALGSYRPTAKGGKTTRTLLFELTDGFQVIKAVEYIPIPAIPDCVTPGLKVQLKGSILCRNRILLISPDNISILGGSAEDLVDEFNLTTIFNNILSNSGEGKDVVASSTKNTVGSSRQKDLKVQSVPERLAATTHSSIANYVEEDFEELLKDELLADEDAFMHDEIPEVEDPIMPELYENELKIDEARSLNFNSADSCKEKNRGAKFIYLLEFLKETNPRTNLVKVYIVTFLSKLDVQKTSYTLTVCIDDGSAVAVVNISSHVIEKLLGFPPLKIYEYKENSQPLPQRVKQAIVRCQQHLATRLWQMQLNKNENEHTIEVVEMTEI